MSSSEGTSTGSDDMVFQAMSKEEQENLCTGCLQSQREQLRQGWSHGPWLQPFSTMGVWIFRLFENAQLMNLLHPLLLPDMAEENIFPKIKRLPVVS